MKVAILSREPKSYSTKRLEQACEQRGHAVEVLDTLRVAIMTERNRPKLYHADRRIKDVDAIIPRIGASITFFGTAVVRQFEQMGVFTLNASHAITISRDKLRSLQVLSRHDIGMPPTAFVRDKNSLLPAIERLGGAPVIVKVLEGTQGVGVILADTNKMAQAIVETLQSARQNVLIQKFVAESRGRDIRAIVVGGRVVAAMRRVASGEEFRSNVHRGGRTENITLPKDYERTAIHAAQILGLRAAGVDMLESSEGPQVMEVNSSPGLEGIERATGIDVAEALVEHIEDQVLFPEVDVRQRLTLEKGYTITEFHVPPDFPLLGLTLEESGLDARDVRVLSIQRGSVVIPNPGGQERILLGDALLCYGKALTLKTLIPKDPAGRRRGAQQEAEGE
ncbi:MAG: RimK family alpha-L-glutamate ligase [Myxococcota bacterium]